MTGPPGPEPVEFVQQERVRDLSGVRFTFAEPQLAEEVLVVHLEPCAICGCEVCAEIDS